jgi:AraC family transcriptional regulator
LTTCWVFWQNLDALHHFYSHRCPMGKDPVYPNNLKEENSEPSILLRFPDILAKKPVLTSYDTGWESVSVENQRQPKTETPEFCLDHYVIGIYLGQGCQMEMEWISEGRQYQGKFVNGTIAFFAMSHSYKARWDRSVNSLVLNLKSGLLARNAEEYLESDVFELLPHFGINDPLIHQIGLALYTDLESQRPGGKLYAEQMANTLAIHLLRFYSSSNHQLRERWDCVSPHRFQPVFDYIEDSLDQDISLSTLSQIANLTQYHFLRTFKEITGLTPHQYVIRQRVKRAKQLLQQGKMSISEVALICGFTHQSHLHRHFKRLLGVTPGEFRGQ